jgi:hypothetical protein
MCVNEHLLSRLHPPALAKYLHGTTIIGEGLDLGLDLVFASGADAEAEVGIAEADAAEAEAAAAAGIADALSDISVKQQRMGEKVQVGRDAREMEKAQRILRKRKQKDGA